MATLSDKISDSGPIAALYFSVKKESIELKEFAISCRALGRDAEKFILRSMFETLKAKYGTQRILVGFKTGPKNQPAYEFVIRFFEKELDSYLLNTDKLLNDTSQWYRFVCGA